MGKHSAAIDVYQEAENTGVEDWEIWYSKGLCYMQWKKYAEAADAFQNANSIQCHDATYLQLGKVRRPRPSPRQAGLLVTRVCRCSQVYTQQGDFKSAVDVYLEALEFSPDNAGARWPLLPLSAMGHPHSSLPRDADHRRPPPSAHGRELPRV